MRHSVLIVALLTAFGIETLGAQTPERFSLAGPRAAVFNLAGEVRVERGSGENVVVEINRGGADADRLAVRTGAIEGWSALRVIYPDDDIVYPRIGRGSRTSFEIGADGTFSTHILRATVGTSGFSVPSSRGDRGNRITVTGRGSGLEAYADMRVLVPAGKSVSVHLGTGRVNVSNVDGDVRVITSSGSVSATGVNGSLLIDTGSGSVNAGMINGHTLIDTGSGAVDVSDVSNGNLSIDTGSGGIDAVEINVRTANFDTGSGGITLTRVQGETVKANTGSGGIRGNGVQARDINFDTGSGSIVLRLLSDVDNLVLDTGSGGVTLYVPRGLGAQIEADSGGGSVTTDIPIELTLKRRDHIRGRIGDGNGRIMIDTGSGGISIRAN